MEQVERLVVVGDSVTATGLREDNRDSYVSMFSQRLRDAGVGVEVIPSALDGIDTDYALKRFKRMVTAHEPDHVLVMLGLNDAQPAGGRSSSSPAEFSENLSKIIEGILDIGAIPTLMTPNPRFDITSASPADDDLMPPYVAAMHEVARSYLVDCIDIHSRFRATGNFRSLIPDGVHPNPPGHRLIADALAEELMPKLQTGKSPAPTQ
jgi:acyl-CoA thioesterase-1